MNGGRLKMTAWFGERDRSGGELVADALLDLYERHGLATSILLRGIEGFGLKHHLRTDRLLSLSEDLPVASIAVDREDRIRAALGEATKLERHGMVTLERARMLAGGHEFIPRPGSGTHETKLTVYLGRKERIGGRPAFMAVCELLRQHGVAGATALLGVDGTRHGRRVRARFFDRNADVPVMLVAVGSESSIADGLEAIDGLLDRPIATLERVRICKRDGVFSAPPHPPADAESRHFETWQKLTVYTGEAARHEGGSIHRQIVRRLRESGAAGATALRGIWGYHGDHRPHGDRPFQLRRHVPVLTTVVDTPERIASAFAIIDELTGETGLVTSEIVPAMPGSTHGHSRGSLALDRDQSPP
ncbi:MAG: DUF190 domain-containing protein [Actinomycetota bacterium]|nr:DUF190 domain-containing protein [Actinomycetota bacterium]